MPGKNPASLFYFLAIVRIRLSKSDIHQPPNITVFSSRFIFHLKIQKTETLDFASWWIWAPDHIRVHNIFKTNSIFLNRGGKFNEILVKIIIGDFFLHLQLYTGCGEDFLFCLGQVRHKVGVEDGLLAELAN